MTSSTIIPLRGNAKYILDIREMKNGSELTGELRCRMLIKLKRDIASLIAYHKKLLKEELDITNVRLIKRDCYNDSIEIILSDYKVNSGLVINYNKG